MKTINLDFLAIDDNIYHLLLAYMYDEIKYMSDNVRRQEIISAFVELNKMDTTLRHIRFGGYDYRDGLENVINLNQTIHLYETFISFVDKYFPEYKEISIIGKTRNSYWRYDLNKISITYNIK